MIDAEEEFWGKGDSSDEALHDCLLKIKETPFDQIFRFLEKLLSPPKGE